MRLLAIDPGKKSGWALFDEMKIKVSGTFQYGDDVLAVADFLDCTDFDILAIEDQYLKHAKGFATLVFRRAVWEVLAIERRKDVVRVYPASWMSQLHGLSPEKAAKAITGRNCGSPDEAAAIMIGNWVLSTTSELTRIASRRKK